jgi:rhodanese-related sulfurtransferase
MPIELRKEEVRQMIRDGAQLVEVLSPRAYQKIHLAEAINLPLYKLDAESGARLDKSKPVIVYCAGYQ